MTQQDKTEYIFFEGVKKGDSKVIQLIYKKYHKAIVHLVESNQGSKEDAHDLFQEALVVVYQKFQSPDFKLSSRFFTYFYAVCRNLWLQKLRKKSIKEVTLEPEMESMLKEAPNPSTEKESQYFLYRKMFQKLGKDCQKILNLFLQKVSMAEIMKQMGHGSINYTKKRKFQCKEKLVLLIKKDPNYKALKGL